MDHLVHQAQITYVPAPEGAPADAPRVFTAINAVMRDAMPVGKNQQNAQQNYKFRGIDDVMSAMAGPMRKHGLFILPSIIKHEQQRDGKMTRTVITMRYHVYGPAGDCLAADVPGEAFDFADKSTNKAQSAALKYLLFTLFMLPVDGRSIDDGDRHHPEPTAEQRAEQAQRQQRRAQQRQQQPRHNGNTTRPEPGNQQVPQQRQTAPARPTPAPQDEADPWETDRAAAPGAWAGTVAAPPSPDTDERQKALAEMRAAAEAANFTDGLPAQFAQSFGHPIEQGTADEFRQARDLMLGTAAA